MIGGDGGAEEGAALVGSPEPGSRVERPPGASDVPRSTPPCGHRGRGPRRPARSPRQRRPPRPRDRPGPARNLVRVFACQESHEVPAAVTPQQLAAADIDGDGDGDTDLVLGDPDGTITTVRAQ